MICPYNPSQPELQKTKSPATETDLLSLLSCCQSTTCYQLGQEVSKITLPCQDKQSQEKAAAICCCVSLPDLRPLSAIRALNKLLLLHKPSIPCKREAGPCHVLSKQSTIHWRLTLVPFLTLLPLFCTPKYSIGTKVLTYVCGRHKGSDNSTRHFKFSAYFIMWSVIPKESSPAAIEKHSCMGPISCKEAKSPATEKHSQTWPMPPQGS